MDMRRGNARRARRLPKNREGGDQRGSEHTRQRHEVLWQQSEYEFFTPGGCEKAIRGIAGQQSECSRTCHSPTVRRTLAKGAQSTTPLIRITRMAPRDDVSEAERSNRHYGLLSMPSSLPTT